MSQKKKISGDLVKVINETIYPAIIYQKAEKEEGENFLLPGFVDAHVHIESTMLPPSEFA